MLVEGVHAPVLVRGLEVYRTGTMPVPNFFIYSIGVELHDDTMVAMTRTASSRGRATTSRIFIRYLSQVLLFVTGTVLISHHFLLLQSNVVVVDFSNAYRWGPLKPNEAAQTLFTTTSTRIAGGYIKVSKPGRTPISNNLTDSLPLWLIEYAEWHDTMRQRGDWSKQPILLVVAKDELAEGLSDRLRSLPFLLWEAYQTKRLLLIQWLRPYPLEEFILPPVGGVDWRVPTATGLRLNEPSPDVVWHEYEDNFTSIADSPYQHYRVVKTQPNRWAFLEGMDYVYMSLNKTYPDEQLSRIYKLLLTPSPPVQRLLDETMQQLGLVPKQFIGVHLRARYPDYVVQFRFIPNGWNETAVHSEYKPKVDEFGRRHVLLDPKGLAVDRAGIMETERAVGQLRQLVSSAIRCARLNLPNANPPTPIYFASDTNLAIKLALNATEHVVGSVSDDERLHMNVDNEKREYRPSDFYPAIVDSWVLSQARCIAAGQGGYSLFAAVLGGAGNCTVFHAMQNLYASRYLPHGYVTIRNITFCKPQKDKMIRKLRNLIESQRLEARSPGAKRFTAHATWNIGN